MNKDLFKNPKSRHSGMDLFESENSQTSPIADDSPKTHSFTIQPSYIEKIRNIVHFKKLNGHPYFTQGELIQNSLDLYIEKLGIDIPERPLEVKEAEKKRTGRRSARKNKSGFSSNDLSM